MQVYPHLGAFETTKIHGSGKDVLGTTRHLERWEHDLALLHESGIDWLRYSVPWHRIESDFASWDWSWIDGPKRFMQRNGMRPILDTLHHTSYPDWLHEGFANPLFPAWYERFAAQVADRYEWVEEYTVFNEPFPTTLFGSLTGMWYPHQSSDRHFVAMAVNVAKAICGVSHMLLRKNPRIQLFHTDTCEHHKPLDKKSEAWVEFVNERRFFLHELVLGRIGKSHPLYRWVKKNGGQDDDLLWLEDNAAPIHVLGLDYYWHSEIDWYWETRHNAANIRMPCKTPRGFASSAQDYIKRVGAPVMLSETNIRGYVSDRLTWLKYMEEECELLVKQGVDFRGFCWYPSIDSTDWCHCLAKCTSSVDPQGIWWLDQGRWERHSSELSYYYSQLAQGKVTAKDLPAYRVLPPVDRDLEGFLPLMAHWKEWREPGEAQQVA